MQYLKNLKVREVSLVDKAANRESWGRDGVIKCIGCLQTFAKVDKAQQIVAGAVYRVSHLTSGQPDLVDAQGDFTLPGQLEKAEESWKKAGCPIFLMHQTPLGEKVRVLKSLTAPRDMEIEGQSLRAGDWWVECRIEDPDLWQQVLKGELTGYSMGGSAVGGTVEDAVNESVQKAVVSHYGPEDVAEEAREVHELAQEIGMSKTKCGCHGKETDAEAHEAHELAELIELQRHQLELLQQLDTMEHPDPLRKESQLPWAPGQPLPARPEIPQGELDDWNEVAEGVADYLKKNLVAFKVSHGAACSTEITAAVEKMWAHVVQVGIVAMETEERVRILTDALDTADALWLIEAQPQDNSPRPTQGGLPTNAGYTTANMRHHPSQVRGPRQ